MKANCNKTKTNEHIKVVLINGKVKKYSVYADENGNKYIYYYGGFFTLEDFVKNRKTI